MPAMMPRVPAMTKWCFSLGRGNIPPRWILAGQSVLSKMPWLFEDWDYFALYASVRCLRCEHWRLMRLFYLLREGASKPYSRLCPPQRPTVWVLEWSPADFANFWTNSNVLRARDEQPLMEDHNIFWDLYKQAHLDLLNGADVSCQCNLEVSFLWKKIFAQNIALLSIYRDFSFLYPWIRKDGNIYRASPLSWWVSLFITPPTWSTTIIHKIHKCVQK